MSKITRKVDLLFMIRVSNPIALNTFLRKNPEIYNSETKTLNIPESEFVKRYKDYIYSQRMKGTLKAHEALKAKRESLANQQK